MTPEQFLERFGKVPEDDDIQRAICPQAGEVGHRNCGICPTHDKPRFMCGCLHTESKPDTSKSLCTEESRLCVRDDSSQEVCDAYSHSYWCTRTKGHEGPHVACGCSGHNYFTWEQV